MPTLLSCFLALGVLSMDAAAFKPTIRLEPAEATVAPGGEVRFVAHLNYDPDGPRYARVPVRFEVLGAGGGTIGVSDGRYVAPATAGRYRIRATRTDFPEVHADGQVTVQAP